MRTRFLFTAAVSMVMAAGCATSFTGNAHVTGGVAGCEAKCKTWGLELAGMVAMGEYSDACICRRPGEKTALVDDAASAAGSAAGVVMEMKRAEDERQQSTLIH
jgi:hypothetical protein